MIGLVLIGTAALALGGCVRRGGTVPYAPADFGPPDKEQASEVAYDLPLGPLDVLAVKVFRVPELSGEYQVDAKGMLDLPLLGPTSVRNKSPEEFSRELERLYGAKYLNNPQISVRVTQTINNSVTLEGGLAVPGVYQLPGRTTLLGAVALARGIAQQDANPKRVVIFRKRNGQTMAAAFDLISIRHGEMEDPLVYPGDVIVVDSSQLRPLYRDLIQSLPLVTIFTRL
ncbi:MAG: polysaccharide biosynthesis/export family protein [Novosphingobium sp.]